MARFSVGGHDERDEERDDRSRFKRRRILATTSVRRVSDGVNPIYQRLESESESESESERFSPSPSPPSFLAPDSPTREEENQEEGEEFGAVESSNSAGNGVTLSDADVLDCPICLDPLAPPVYQVILFHASLLLNPIDVFITTTSNHKLFACCDARPVVYSIKISTFYSMNGANSILNLNIIASTQKSESGCCCVIL